ncbi:MAG: hypothetical protein U5L01_07095 [Rheinheimera sp.]|nr:hypothetical protein [Rheinheimera sp.]
MTAPAQANIHRPDDEMIQREMAVSLAIREQYGTNQPGNTYEQGVAAALLWVLGNGEMPNGECQGMERTD